jgi:hypothetical protein
MGTYATRQDIRDEGVSVAEASDSRVDMLLELASRYIDRMTRRWFEPRALVVKADGSGSRVLHFDIPIISVSQVRILNSYDGSGQVVAAAGYRVYNRHLSGLTAPDDRDNPRLEYLSDYFSATSRSGDDGYVWPEGEQNVEVTGVFGFTDWDPTGVATQGLTPTLIKHACKLLVVRMVPLMDDAAARAEKSNLYRVMTEKTADQEIRYSEGGQLTGSYTGDNEIDLLLESFQRPMALRVV